MAQQIYEEYMYTATLKLKDKTVFDLDAFSDIMKEYYYYEMRDKNQPRDPDYYVIRYSGLFTHIHEYTYPGLANIFFNSIDQLLQSNPDEFAEKCNKEKKLEGCYKCFCYHPLTYGFNLTEHMESDKDKYSFFQAYITTLNNKIPTITLFVDKELQIIATRHTSVENMYIIIEVVKHYWNMIEQHKNSGDIRLKSLCFYIHWLLCNATPFRRGSAGFSKVVLNACLLKCGLEKMKETKEYFRKSDWVAMFSPTFDIYLEKCDSMFEIDERVFSLKPIRTTSVSVSDDIGDKFLPKSKKSKSKKSKSKKSKSKKSKSKKSKNKSKKKSKKSKKSKNKKSKNKKSKSKNKKSKNKKSKL